MGHRLRNVGMRRGRLEMEDDFRDLDMILNIASRLLSNRRLFLKTLTKSHLPCDSRLN